MEDSARYILKFVSLAFLSLDMRFINHTLNQYLSLHLKRHLKFNKLRNELFIYF